MSNLDTIKELLELAMEEGFVSEPEPEKYELTEAGQLALAGMIFFEFEETKPNPTLSPEEFSTELEAFTRKLMEEANHSLILFVRLSLLQAARNRDEKRVLH
jgi:hypothetical protein